MKYDLMLAISKAGEISAAELYEQFKLQITQETVKQFREFYLTPLKIEGTLVSLACDKWALTETGAKELEIKRVHAVVNESPKFVGVKAEPRKVVIPTNLYQGKELGKTCNRAGAYDAYAIPSLIGNKRVMPRPIKE